MADPRHSHSSPPGRKPRRSFGGRPGAPRTPTAWDRAARWYDKVVGEEGSFYQREVVMPRALRLLDLRRGARVLDLACGQGVFTRFLQQHKHQAVGADVAEQLIRIARQRSPGVEFQVADAADPSALPGQSFDGIACLLALQNMPDLVPVMRNVARWLKKRAYFVAVITHPCFRIPRQSHWGFDAEKKLEYRRVDRYFTELEIPILTTRPGTHEIYTTTWHRPLQAYFHALAAAGLVVDALQEWESTKDDQPGPQAEAHRRARREFPLFLALRSRKG